LLGFVASLDQDAISGTRIGIVAEWLATSMDKRMIVLADLCHSGF
jgi:hypothetical protein